MQRTRSSSGPLLGGKQRGQALIYGLFVLIGGLAALFFLFNTGQLAREKTKLVNTADAVAYSAGVMHARGLNFEAYTNRAMVANSVAIAQLVSLASWVQYADRLGTYGAVVADPLRYPLFYFSSYLPALTVGSELQLTLNDAGALERLASASDRTVRGALMNAQQVAHLGLLPARKQVMDEVAEANYRNDGMVEVDPVPLTAVDYSGFVKRYGGDERTRFAEVAKASAGRDRFVPARSWSMPALLPTCLSAWPRTDWLDRRGGTELIGFDEWKAMDTLSEKRWVPKSKTDVLCQGVAETPGGWGMQAAADDPSLDVDPTHYDGSLPVNPGSSALALVTSGSWGYSGLPNFYELSNDAMTKDDPRLPFAIRLRRSQSQTLTSEGRSAIRSSARLNAYQARPAGGSDMVAAAREQAHEHGARRLVIIDDEQPQGAGGCGVRSDHACRGGGRIDGGEGDGEDRAEAVALALGADRTAVDFDDRLRDGQPQAEPAVAMLAGDVALLEGLENIRQRFGADADAGILDADEDPILDVVARAHGDAPAGGGEFERVLDQVPKDLLEPRGIGQRMMPRRFEHEDDAHLLAEPVATDDLGGVLEELVQVGSHRRDGQLAAADARDVEQVVDQPRLEFDVAAHHPELIAHFERQGEIGLECGGGHQHRCERRAQLVAEGGEEVVLGTRAALDFSHRHAQRLLRLLAFDDVFDGEHNP